MTQLPRRFGEHQLLQLLARGGMGEVYLARRAGSDLLVAVKTLRQEHTADREFVGRFVDEARVAVLLEHPKVNRVRDVGYCEGTYFLELEYIAGRDMRAVFERARDLERAIPIDIAAYITLCLLEALGYLHQLRDRELRPMHMVHRDVSPQNVIASWAGDVVLIDFGLARFRARSSVTQPGTVMGKVRYMSPEQARGLDVDQRTDLFAAGAVLYELLSGVRLYESVTAEALWITVAEGRAIDNVQMDLLPLGARPVVARALSSDPASRYHSAAEMAEDVALLTAHAPHVLRARLQALLADLFEVDLQVEHELMVELGRIAPFEVSAFEATRTMSLVDPATQMPWAFSLRGAAPSAGVVRDVREVAAPEVEEATYLLPTARISPAPHTPPPTIAAPPPQAAVARSTVTLRWLLLAALLGGAALLLATLAVVSGRLRPPRQAVTTQHADAGTTGTQVTPEDPIASQPLSQLVDSVIYDMHTKGVMPRDVAAQWPQLSAALLPDTEPTLRRDLLLQLQGELSRFELSYAFLDAKSARIQVRYASLAVHRSRVAVDRYRQMLEAFARASSRRSDPDALGLANDRLNALDVALDATDPELRHKPPRPGFRERR